MQDTHSQFLPSLHICLAAFCFISFYLVLIYFTAKTVTYLKEDVRASHMVQLIKVSHSE